MQPSTVLRGQLLGLCAGDVGDSEHLAAELTGLCQTIRAAVPSTLSVTLALVREGAELSFTVSANAESFGPILSSLAGPLPAGEPGALLIVRAGNANAFDATPGHPELWLGLDPTHLQVDQHLVSALFEPDVSLPLALRELQSVQQSLGALIELGLEPAGARAELARRADIAGTTVAVASRALLAEVPLARPGDDG